MTMDASGRETTCGCPADAPVDTPTGLTGYCEHGQPRAGRKAAPDERERLAQAVRDLPGYGDPVGGLVSREAVLALLTSPARPEYAATAVRPSRVIWPAPPTRAPAW